MGGVWRFRTPPGPVTFQDRVWGTQAYDPDEDPVRVLEAVGIVPPGHSPPQKDATPGRPARRWATVIVGVSPANVAPHLPPGGRAVRVEACPLGTILWEPGSETLNWLAVQTGARVYDVHYAPQADDFEVQVLEGERFLGAFSPGDVATGAPGEPPIVDDILGETKPPAIVARLGLPASFLARPDRAS